jgi:hypothetical protein
MQKCSPYIVYIMLIWIIHQKTKPSILVQPSKAQQTSFKLAEFILEDGWDGKQTRGPDIISVNDGFSV